MTTRNSTLVVGKRIEGELVGEVECPTTVAEPAKHLTVGIDGAFVKAKPDQAGGQPFEILTGRVERERGRGRAFAIVRNLDARAKQKIQAVLRRCGRSPETKLTLLSDGEDGLRGVVGWFGKNCRQLLDWFHVRRRFEKIARELLYLPHRADFSRFLSRHSQNLARVKHVLWNQGIEMADWAMKLFRCGLVKTPGTTLKSTSNVLNVFKRSRRSSMNYAHTCTRTARPHRVTPVLFATVNESERRTWNRR